MDFNFPDLDTNFEPFDPFAQSVEDNSPPQNSLDQGLISQVQNCEGAFVKKKKTTNFFFSFLCVCVLLKSYWEMANTHNGEKV